MSEQEPDKTTLTRAEMATVERIAQRDGLTTDEAATQLVKAALARRVKKKSGKVPAKVYSLRKPK